MKSAESVRRYTLTQRIAGFHTANGSSAKRPPATVRLWAACGIVYSEKRRTREFMRALANDDADGVIHVDDVDPVARNVADGFYFRVRRDGAVFIGWTMAVTLSLILAVASTYLPRTTATTWRSRLPCN